MQEPAKPVLVAQVKKSEVKLVDGETHTPTNDRAAGGGMKATCMNLWGKKWQNMMYAKYNFMTKL